MTIQDWAIIVIAISAPIAAFATLLAPSLAEIVKFRINQPKPSPDPNQPENLIQRKGGRSLKRILLSPLAICAVEIFFLIGQVRSPSPIDKASVLTISFLASSILFMLMAMGLLYLSKVTLDVFKIQLEVHRVTYERIDFTESWLSTLTRSLLATINNDPVRAKHLLKDLGKTLKSQTASPEAPDQSK